jgi:hypothetical protein
MIFVDHDCVQLPIACSGVDSGGSMRHLCCALLLLTLSVPLAMAKKDKGTTTLKDVQPAGLTSKENENQQFDFSFDASGMSYVCRLATRTR